MSKPEIYKERIELRLSKKQKDRLQKHAQKIEQTMNQVLRDFIEDYCSS